VSKYRLIAAEKANFDITMMCRILEVARSAYYAWTNRPACAREVRAQELGQRIAVLHADSDGTYGAPRILADLRAEGTVVSAKTVAKAMRARGLAGCGPRPWRTTTIPETDSANVPVDRVERDFDRGRLDAVCVGDITY
jgi:putative transposase